MAIEIKLHPGKTRFSGMSGIGKPIFDLSVNVVLPKKSAAFDLVDRVQSQAREKVANAHILPGKQTHITFNNPVFQMAGSSMVSDAAAQNKLFGKFVAILRTDRHAQAIVGMEHELRFAGIAVNERDVKLLVAEGPKRYKLIAAQGALGKVLKGHDRRFDLADELPPLACTILRFGPKFGESDHEKLLAVLRRTADQYSPDQLNVGFSAADMLAVKFTRLFFPWDKEAAVA
jgi:hypothetical protein